MQKVGMDKREVRRSIRSQVLTVFFLPLIVAFVHIAVAFKVITNLLITFNTVSYTHLDVYKRQPLRRYGGRISAWGRR